MKKKNLRELLQKKVVLVGCAVLTAVAVIGGTFAYQANQANEVPELVSFVDSIEGDTIIGDEEVPLAGAKTTTKTSTKKSTKKVKLAKAASKTYTKALPATKKNSTKSSSTSTSKIKKITTVKTVKTEKYQKKSKVKTVTTQVTTTVKTTVTPISQVYTVAVTQIAPKANSKVLNAYEDLGFTVKVDSTVTSYTGYFSAKPDAKSIILKSSDSTIYHELGHFLAFIAGNADRNATFQSVYSAEKSKYTGVNKNYVTSNSSEYFAESFRDYTLNPSTLRSSRPKTYAAIEAALDKVSDSRVALINKIYYA